MFKLCSYIYIFYLLISMQNLCWFICYDLIKILYIFYMGGEGWINVWLSTPHTKHLFFVKMRCVAQRAHRRPCGAPTRSSFGLANRVNPSAPSKKCRTFFNKMQNTHVTTTHEVRYVIRYLCHISHLFIYLCVARFFLRGTCVVHIYTCACVVHIYTQPC